MAQGWRILDATSFAGVVGAKRGSITLTPHGESAAKHVVPAEEVAVILIGVNTWLTSAAIQRLAEHDIALLSSDWRGVPLAGLYPWSDHGRVAARHIAQAGLSLPRKKNAWKQIVRAKIAGQAATLRVVDLHGANQLDALAKQVRSGDPANVEGNAARMYWPRLFHGRSDVFRRLPEGEDPTNSLLNYGYGVLRGYGVRAVLGAGLSPPLGLFHRGRGNYFNLVDDLMEPFRPAVDAVVVTLGVRATLEDPDVKKALVDSASQPFTSDGRRIPSVLLDLAQQLGRYVENDLEKLPVPTWNGIPKVTTQPTPSAPDPDLDWNPPW